MPWLKVAPPSPREGAAGFLCRTQTRQNGKFAGFPSFLPDFGKNSEKIPENFRTFCGGTREYCRVP
jgi:hypothetical protein